ncbi:MCM-domain-containing protein [Fragilariopsis cylindrus CCMP1102]|uniref:DNA replication licensing factor MCM7 n=1 Tax=Fragilariopsis cylindrus CCMP1102 TaxID=635003 RepID=A0A1E7FHB5_9STRA|nr:MCM-domain-containing protein [Fragilariopsis cylindrus CCMP1102]|eukprot:OEU17576.1 MCM-domain-containing protein [Fragilariopsis cylindrus CCMP1102]
MNAFPPMLMRRYELRILPFGRHTDRAGNVGDDGIPRGVSLRHVRSKSMGRIVTITGMIVKASDVKPMLQVAAYTCDVCGAELYRETHNRRDFLPERICPVCASSGGGGTADGQRGRRVMGVLKLETRGSKFTKFQELKLQELPNQVPMGHIPRSLSVYCRGELTRLASPGDVVTVDGIFLPQKVNDGHGAKGRKAGLMSTLFVDAQNLSVHKNSLDDASHRDRLSEEELVRLDSDIRKVTSSEDPIGILSRSIAPEIFGHANVKRALLLQLTGGVFRKMTDGMRIRGDINICLMGDPGVAKSQLLKHVASVAPRGVYTTGKGSSGVGLTASITKDNMTGELSLEGGALVLADRGICAIDEFDKMDESDRSSIHEVMEQQTVSIAKAGIVATLNARASVLAAANPLYSRYNRNKSLSENINLPNSLLSRFDLMFLILDVPDIDRDMALARHVTFVHQNEGLEEKKDDSDSDDDDEGNTDAVIKSDYDEEKGLVSPMLLREYISRARRHDPVVPPEVAPYIVEAYVSLRMQDRPGKNIKMSGGSKTGDQTAMTARQLLSILRLGQALARLRFSDFVAREDVDEAIRLTHMSKATLSEETGDDGKSVRREDVMSRIFNIIRDYSATSNTTTVELKLVEAMVIRKGFTVQQMQSCLEEYEALEVIQVNQNRTQIHFIT